MSGRAIPFSASIPSAAEVWGLAATLSAQGFRLVRSSPPQTDRRGAVVVRALLRKEVPGDVPVTVRVSVSIPRAR